MKNTHKSQLNTFIFGLAILAFLSFGLIAPTPAHADRAGIVTPYGSTDFPDVNANNHYNTYTGQSTSYVPPRTYTYVPPATVVRYGSSTPTPTIYSNSTGPKTTISTTTVKKVTTAPKTNPTQDLSNLSANAVYGSNSFLPSGLIQWILLAIFILIIIILVRKVSGAEDKYHSEPLKHA